MTTLSAAQIARVAYRAGFRGDRLVTAVAVALGESSGRVEVVNSIGCVGLWQINQPVHVSSHPNWTRAWLQNADHNATAAHILSDDGVNWRPWQVYTTGSYRAHLPAARAAAGGAASNSGGSPSGPSGGTSSGGHSHGDGPNKPKAGTKLLPKPPPPPKAIEDPDPRIRLGRLFVRAAKLHENVASAVTAADLSWSTTEVTQLSLTIADPGFVLYTGAHFIKGMRLLYREPGMPELALRIAGISLDGGPVGTGGMTVNCRSEVAWKLKRRRGAHVMRKVSPTAYLRAECKAVGAKFVGQGTTTRSQVRRDVPTDGDATQGSSAPSAWTTFQRLAGEVGFVCFEYADTVYFGKPTWLVEHAGSLLYVAMPLPGQPLVWRAEAMPSIDVSDDADVAVTVGSIQIPSQRLKEVNPGRAMQLLGLPPYDKHPLLISSMSMSLLGSTPIALEASTPVNPDPQPPEKAGGGGSGTGTGTGTSSSTGTTPSSSGGGGPVQQNGSRSAAAFVAMATTASNARYVFGAEASVSDPSPSSLDCSELVQWALGRVGIPFVDGSSAQYAACRKISVSQAMATRGALLHIEGHIGISMGDGRSVEARNPSAGVGIFRAADIRWTGGGLVPGLRYG